MYNLCIIGSSDIVSKHLTAARNNGFKLYAITSLKHNSNNARNLKRKFKIKKFFSDWKTCIKTCSKIKNISFLVAPRIEDTIKVLNYISNFDKPIIVEKPISTDIKKLKRIKNKNFFVGYNRIFYKSVNYIKEKYLNKKNRSVLNVLCPEKNKKSFITNSCHIISILIYLFGDLNVQIIKKNKKVILCVLKNKNVHINLSVVFNAPANFKIDFFIENTHLKLSPVEELTEYKGLKKIQKKNFNLYKPILTKSINDYDIYLKPGFNAQYKLFKKFCDKKKIKIPNTYNFAEKILKICLKIAK